MSVSLVARRHGIGGNQIFNWRQLMAQSALTAMAVSGEVVPASEYRALDTQVRELHRLLGKGYGKRTAPRGRVPGRRPRNCFALDLVAAGSTVSGRRGGRHRSPTPVHNTPSPSAPTTRRTTAAAWRVGGRRPRARRRSISQRLSTRSWSAAPTGRKDQTRSAQSETRLPRHRISRAAGTARRRTPRGT